MLKRPTDERKRLELYQAMNAVKHTSDGQIIIKYLKSELQRLQDNNDKEDDITTFRQIQGANQYGKKFLSMIEVSSEEIKKLR